MMPPFLFEMFFLGLGLGLKFNAKKVEFWGVMSFRGYVDNFSVKEVNLSFIALIRSEYPPIFDLSDLAMSSKYDVYDSISLSIASTVTDR